MLTETLDKLIQEEINKGIENFQEEYKAAKESSEKYYKLYTEGKQKVAELTKIKNQLNEFKTFQDLINKDNFETISTYLGLEEIKINFNGMNSEGIPVWFKLLCTHYKDKDRLFTLMNMFNIEYPHWAKTFKLPFDYGEEELDLIFDHLGKMYVCNNEIFSNNMGFFYNYQSMFKGNLKDLFCRESYVEIPWNLFLQNPLLTREKYFNLIIKAIAKRQPHSDYFFMIQNYQELNAEQVNRMAELLPASYFYSYHTNFLSKNKGVFKLRSDLAVKFKDRIKGNHYSEFHYLNYPSEMQKEFVLQNSNYYNSYGFDLVKNMEISDEEKVELLSEIARKLLTEKD